MANPFEDAARQHDLIKEAHAKAVKLIDELQQAVKRYEAKLEVLYSELENAKMRSDHYLRLYCEICKNLNTIGLVVDDALNTAHMEIGKRNGGQIQNEQKLLDAVDRAARDMRDDTVQRKEEERPGVHDNQVHGRS
jgi:hypothetical protein